MHVATNTHPSEAGKKLLQRLQEKTFTGYVRSCVDPLLADIDAGKYSFDDIGTDEVTVLDMAIKHMAGEKNLDAFVLTMYVSGLEARKQKARGANLPPSYAHVYPKPHLVASNTEPVLSEVEREAA